MAAKNVFGSRRKRGLALRDAVQRDDVAAVLRMVNGRAEIASAMALAVHDGSNQVLAALIETYPAAVHQRVFGSTPLAAAAGRGQLESARLLLCAGADPNALGRLIPIYILTMAAVRRDKGMVDLLLANGARVLPSVMVSMAASKNNVEMLSYLLERGGGVNAASVDGRTPLMQAARQRRVDAVRFLLDHGANPQLMDKAGRTALDHTSPGLLRRLTEDAADRAKTEEIRQMLLARS